jgi:hypothetical protein
MEGRALEPSRVHQGQFGKAPPVAPPQELFNP